MAKSGRMGGDPNSRMSNVMSGVERSHRGEPSYRAQSTVRNESYANSPVLGTSGPFKTRSLTVASNKGSLPKPTGVETVAGVKAKNIPRSYVPSRIKQIFDPTPFATPVVKMPAAKTKKPVAKPAAQVISNVTNEKLSPAKKAMAKPPATRFGTVTGKTTGTTVRGGGGYGGGGTRGGGSLSGGGSGTRSAGTSRTGGTRSNDPVRG